MSVNLNPSTTDSLVSAANAFNHSTTDSLASSTNSAVETTKLPEIDETNEATYARIRIEFLQKKVLKTPSNSNKNPIQPLTHVAKNHRRKKTNNKTQNLLCIQTKQQKEENAKRKHAEFVDLCAQLLAVQEPSYPESAHTPKPASSPRNGAIAEGAEGDAIPTNDESRDSDQCLVSDSSAK